MFYDFITKYTGIFCWKQWEKILDCKSFSHFVNKKYWHIWDINIWNFNILLINDALVLNQVQLYSATRTPQNVVSHLSVHRDKQTNPENSLKVYAASKDGKLIPMLRQGKNIKWLKPPCQCSRIFIQMVLIKLCNSWGNLYLCQLRPNACQIDSNVLSLLKTRIAWLSRDNLSSPSFALVTYRHVKKFHSFIRQNQNNIMLRQQTFFNIYEPKISIYDIYTSQWPFYCLTFKCDLDVQLTWTNVSNEQLCQIILKSMHKCRSNGLYELNS